MKRHIYMVLSIIIAICFLFGCCAKPADTTPTATIRVKKIESLSSDFVRGADISTLCALEQSGVSFYDSQGNPQDIFLLLSDAGINYLRVRVWNDPYDENGNGYGGGNCDTKKAAELGRRAAQWGIPLCVDFHYSDFWADPTAQRAPKAWQNHSPTEKAIAAYTFTKESLAAIQQAGAKIGMVQIGNEINHGIVDETNPDAVLEILKHAARAVRETAPDIQIAVHYTDPQNKEEILYHTELLKQQAVDYDVLGFSYYPYWHGSLETLTDTLQEASAQSGKPTILLETAYPYTLQDGDGHPNTIGQNILPEAYPATVQGQADYLRDVMAAVHAANGLGIFYWEPAWLPVGTDPAENAALWNEDGSGWASCYAAGYDPDNAGLHHGGSSWDNQALFDFDGSPLPSLDVFRLVYGGSASVHETNIIPSGDIF